MFGRGKDSLLGAGAAVLVLLAAAGCPQPPSTGGGGDNEDDPLEGAAYREMAELPGGTFEQKMTDGSGAAVASFTHQVSGFSMGKYEVTYGLWFAVAQWSEGRGYRFANPGQPGSEGTPGEVPEGETEALPVTGVSWRDAAVWCNAYSEAAGLEPVYRDSSGGVIRDSRDSHAARCDSAFPVWHADGYRLPSEGEWQYAASYGGGADWLEPSHASGDDTGYCCPLDGGASTEFGDYAWYNGNTGRAEPVGTGAANGAGIYDMSGNVYEWCWDWFSGNWAGAGTEAVDWRGAAEGSYRVRRGGSWNDGETKVLQVGYSQGYFPDTANGYYGFRVVRCGE